MEFESVLNPSNYTTRFRWVIFFWVKTTKQAAELWDTYNVN